MHRESAELVAKEWQPCSWSHLLPQLASKRLKTTGLSLLWCGFGR